MTKKKAAPATQVRSSDQDLQDVIIRRAEPYSSGRWCVVLPNRDYSGARLVHTASSKQKALEWASHHLAELGGHSDDRSGVDALEVGHVPFPEV